ncbi:MAG TPA: NRDE family protein, partial [Archangium sp.]
MCTILILRHVHPEWPLVLAANRDEFHARPATGPRVLLESPLAVGGRDVERGGTWMGVTHEGI